MSEDAEKLQKEDEERAIGNPEKIPTWQKRNNEKVIKSNHPEYFNDSEE